MNAEEIRVSIENVESEIKKQIMDDMPRLIGNAAVSMVNQNFRDAGWRDGGLKPWKKTKRQMGKGKGSQYLPLHSSREHLSRSTQYKKTGPGEVTISNPVPYASVHNDGFEGNVNVKAHKRTISKGKNKGNKYSVRAFSRRMYIPQRQFMGESRELNEKIENIIRNTFKNIKVKIGR
jgi:phage gpG-like protein|nr:MAG TPA: tail morphogenesis protein [Caudoviricetes sp.]DAE82088.1 MAG TPA: tail morphogenesis protein [Caudoviricetes sp.]